MNAPFTPGDINSIKAQLTFLKTHSKKIFLGTAVTLAIGLSVGILLGHKPLIIGTASALMISIYINYAISWRWILQLKKDLRGGHKNIERVNIEKIKATKTSKKAIMDNGLTVDFCEFDAHNIDRNQTFLNARFTIEYTPHNKLILDIKGPDRPSLSPE